MPTWPITCGSCGRDVSADVVAGWTGGGQPYQHINATLWLKCPNEGCGEGSVKLKTGAIYPPAPFGPGIDGLPADVASAWDEAGIAFSVGAFTAAEMMCRKLLMHVAVDQAGSQPGKSFVEYVDELEKGGLIITGLRPVIDQVKNRGNTANHTLPPSDEAVSKMTLKITQHLLQGVYELRSLAPKETSPE
jgi:Domain of unknown function (DUF4145)